jgi:hypothetical protein
MLRWPPTLSSVMGLHAVLSQYSPASLNSAWAVACGSVENSG